VTFVSADYLRGLKDRLTPAAIIPMHTPDEAIADPEFVGLQGLHVRQQRRPQGASGRGQRP
jgi:hypothetical protein